MKTFPIHMDSIAAAKKQHFASPLVVPFDFVKRHEDQAMKNHGQTVERLAARGGLSWLELLLVICDKPLFGEYADRFKGKDEAEAFRVVAIMQMHDFSKAHKSQGDTR
ncbi:hypothetical protein AB4851_20610 [Burkholderia sp. 22PA0099]|uniref:hypothetical protein n=1 Tax=Burkholderia sp. 22PA0099 TaxID=3237372 RepID=UPI0039C445BC